VKLGHLTNLRKLTMSALEALPAPGMRLLRTLNLLSAGAPTAKLGASAIATSTVLPTSLQHLVTVGIQDATPLLQLQQLSHVVLT
jgi:hypothetical protein